IAGLNQLSPQLLDCPSKILLCANGRHVGEHSRALSIEIPEKHPMDGRRFVSQPLAREEAPCPSYDMRLAGTMQGRRAMSVFRHLTRPRHQRSMSEPLRTSANLRILRCGNAMCTLSVNFR